MKFRKFLLAAVAAMALPAAAQVGDPAVVHGKLDNGLTYYILPSKNGGNQADFFLARAVGSINEEEDQQGLAHFLEHICFNGTEHFPGNSIITYLESVGVKFGKDLNASTSTDRTIFNISKVPTARQSTLDSCLLILRDWEIGLNLDDKSIEDERGIIREEWRQRRGASNRMLEKAAPKIFPGSIYGQRLPIGKIEIVENFPPQRLRDFYQRWNNPANDAVVVVGDVNPGAIETEIKRLFGSIPAGKEEAKTQTAAVPDNENILIVSETDPEQPIETLTFFFKNPAKKGCCIKGTVRRDLLESLLNDLLVRRLDDIEARPDAVTSKLGVGQQKFMLASPVKALMVRGNVTPGKSKEAFAEIYREIKRAYDLGFSQAEFDDAMKQTMRGFSAAARKAGLRSNADNARRLTRTFLDGERFDTPADRLEVADSISKILTPADVQKYLQSLVDPSGKNLVVLSYAPENAQKVDTDALAATFDAVNTETMQPFTPAKVEFQLLSQEPQRGKVKKSKKNDMFGAEKLALSNGVNVYLMPTKYKDDQIFVRGIGYGGYSQRYTPELAPTMKLMEEIIPLSGFGKLSATDLKRYQESRDIKVASLISNTEETLEISSNRENLEDAFRLMYLKATDIQPDQTAFDALIRDKRDNLARQFKNPIQVMGDSITAIVYSHQPLGGKFKPEMIDGVDYDKALEIYRDRFADVSDFNFYITGDFDRSQIVDLLERYVASLPAAGRKEKAKDIGYRFITGQNDVRFQVPMETPQAVVYQFRNMECPYTLSNILTANAVGQILKSKLLSDIREDKGWVYSITGHGAVTNGMNGQDPSSFMMPTYIKTSPEHALDVENAVNATLEGMANGSITDADVNAVKEYYMKSIAENREDNAYWLSAMRMKDKFGFDMDTDYDKTVAALTPASIAAFIRKYVLPGSRLNLVMTPE